MEAKELYEALDVLASTMHGDELAEVVMALTGTVIEERGTMAGMAAHNPDLATEARTTGLRWLRDHGYAPRTKDEAARYRELTTDRDPYVFPRQCTGRGGNSTCRQGYDDGRPWHVIPPVVDVAKRPALVMPTYHYATIEDGVGSVRAAMATAPMVATDDDLYRYRAAGVAYKLPPGWIDPSRR